MGAAGGSFVLPAGTVTFLLSDIEGSTRLWETEPEAMALSVPAVYSILDQAVAGHGGVRPVEQGEGDSVVAVFPRASDALGAALAAQLALHAQAWPGGIELRVRIAVHTAEAQLRDEGNYFGVALSRCARLRAIAQGGQTLLSRAAHDLVADRLPDGVELADCGIHRLRDLGRPEHVFALVHPGLPGELAGLRSLDALPNNLPDQLTSFVGRTRELGEIAGALEDTRLLTLTGAGGSGKTRLALQAAADSLDRFPDGAWWVDLAPLADPALVGDALAAAVGVRPSLGMTALQVACAHLATRRALIALDNCEHLLEASADVAGALLEGCPGVTVLATSRAPLRLAGESEWRVPSLSLPARERAREPIAALAQCDAVRLFIERARKVRPNFSITDANAPAVAQICHELDGIPLAIELAAARIRILSVEQIADGLGDRFRLLTGGARSVMARQQTLRASVDWSHALLSDQERVLFRRLGVLAGGFGLDGAEGVGAGDGLDAYAVLDLLASLVDKSLVQAEEHGPLVRYRLLETVRQYALDRLGEAGESDATRDRHRDLFTELAVQAAPHLESARQAQWLDALDLDAANFAVALERAAVTDPERALRLAVALTLWWLARGRFAEADSGYAQALAAGADCSNGLRARALWGRASLAARSGAYEVGTEHAAAALELAEADGDAATAARALSAIGMVELFADPARAGPPLERAAALARAGGDAWGEIEAVQVLACTYLFQSDHGSCRRALDKIDALVRGQGYHGQIVRDALARGQMAYFEGRLADGRAYMERARAFSDAVGEPVFAGVADAQLGLLDTLGGEPQRGLDRILPRLDRALSAGAGRTIPHLIIQAGAAEIALGQLDAGRRRLEIAIPPIEDKDVFLAGWALSILADAQRQLHDPVAAERSAARGAEISESAGIPLMAGANRQVLGRLAAARGEWSLAEHHAHAMLDACAQGGFMTFVPETLEALAEVAAGLESDAEAVGLLAAAARARRDLGLARWKGDGEYWTSLTDELGATLDDGFAAAWVSGDALPVEEAIGWARRARGERKRPAIGWESLTPTEQRIVELATEGLTNPQIGERMFISRTTVKTHLEHIYAKLGIHSRTELAATATTRQAQRSPGASRQSDRTSEAGASMGSDRPI